MFAEQRKRIKLVPLILLMILSALIIYLIFSLFLTQKEPASGVLVLFNGRLGESSLLSLMRSF